VRDKETTAREVDHIPTLPDTDSMQHRKQTIRVFSVLLTIFMGSRDRCLESTADSAVMSPQINVAIDFIAF
jgi:hypothetical protein